MVERTECEKWGAVHEELMALIEARETLELMDIYLAEKMDMGEEYFERFKLVPMGSDYDLEKKWMKLHGIDPIKLEKERRELIKKSYEASQKGKKK